jgi:hypothetical protein
MNRKQLSLILGAVVVLGVLGLWSRHLQVSGYKAASGRMGRKVLGEFDVNSVTAVHIQAGTNSLDLVRRDGKWTVQQRKGYPANFTSVRDLVRNLWELKIAQTVQAGESQLARLGLNPPDSKKDAATLVELRGKDGKPIKSLLLGKKHLRKPANPSPMGGDDGWPDGRYVMIPGKLDTLSLVSEPFSNVEPKPDQWLNKDFFKVEKIRRVKVVWPESTNSWELARETATGSMKLVDARPGEELDTSKASSVASALGYPSFTDVVVDPDPAATGLDHPVLITIETFDDFTYHLKVGRPKSGDNYYLTVDVTAKIPTQRKPGKDEKKEDKDKLDQQFKEKVDKLKEKLKKEQALAGWTYRVSKWTLDTLLKKRSDLLKQPETGKKTDGGSTTTSSAAPAAPAAPIVPDLQPVPPPPAPKKATDLIKPAEVKPIAAPPAPPEPKAPASTKQPRAEAKPAARPAGETTEKPAAQSGGKPETPAKTQSETKPETKPRPAKEKTKAPAQSG